MYIYVDIKWYTSRWPRKLLPHLLAVSAFWTRLGSSLGPLEKQRYYSLYTRGTSVHLRSHNCETQYSTPQLAMCVLFSVCVCSSLCMCRYSSSTTILSDWVNYWPDMMRQPSQLREWCVAGWPKEEQWRWERRRDGELLSGSRLVRCGILPSRNLCFTSCLHEPLFDLILSFDLTSYFFLYSYSFISGQVSLPEAARPQKPRCHHHTKRSTSVYIVPVQSAPVVSGPCMCLEMRLCHEM